MVIYRLLCTNQANVEMADIYRLPYKIPGGKTVNNVQIDPHGRVPFDL